MRPADSDHFNGKTFHMPHSHPERGFLDILRWRMTSKPARWPKAVPFTAPPPLPTPRGAEVVATWLGHASWLLQTTRGTILIDPIFSERTSPVSWAGPRRVFPAPIPLAALPPINAICVSHDHYDHCDAPTLRALAARNPRAVFVAPLRHRKLLRRFGVSDVAELDWWDKHTLPGGIELTLTPTQHWSKRLGSRRNYRLWGGFWMGFSNFDSRFPQRAPNEAIQAVGESDGASSGSPIENPKSKIQNQPTVWFVGDSGYDEPLFKTIRERLGPPDVALVPIGAYEPRWFMAPMHMNPDEAVRLHRDCGARMSLAMHWGTFQLTDEARDEPVRALAAARTALGVAPEAFRVLEPGHSWVLAPQ